MKRLFSLSVFLLIISNVVFSQNGTWKKENISANFVALTSPDSNVTVGATNDGNIYINDYSASQGWQLCVTLSGVTGIKSMTYSSAGSKYVYVTTNNGKIYKINWKQCTYTLMNSPSSYTGSINGLTWANGSTAYICGEEGKIFKTENEGNTWVLQNSGVTNFLNDIYAAPGTDNVYVVGSMGTVVTTVNGGSSWTQYDPGVQDWLSEINSIGNNNFLISGSDGFLSQWDGGSVFTPYNTGTTKGFISFDGTAWENSPYQGIIVGDSGMFVLINKDNTLSPIDQIPGTNDYLVAVSTLTISGQKSNEDTLIAYAAGNTGLYRYSEPYIPTGINTIEISGIKIHPNPVTDIVNIELSGNQAISEISIVDQYGRKVLQVFNPSAQQVDLTSIPAGLYFLRVDLGDKIVSRKLIKL
jgi:hypothetical protein